jgi:hypothetical protein
MFYALYHILIYTTLILIQYFTLTNYGSYGPSLSWLEKWIDFKIKNSKYVVVELQSHGENMDPNKNIVTLDPSTNK